MMAHNSTCFLAFRRYLKEHDLQGAWRPGIEKVGSCSKIFSLLGLIIVECLSLSGLWEIPGMEEKKC
jgi:hypothetical protein